MRIAERALDTVEKYLRTDIRYILHGGFWLTTGQVATSLAAFVVAIAYANLLPKELYGTYKYVISLAAILAAFSVTGMNSAITRAVAQGAEGTLRSGTRMRLYGGIAGAIIAALIAVYYYSNGNATIGTAMLVIAAFLPLFDTFNTASAYLYGKREFGRDAFYTMITRAGCAVILVAGIFLTQDLFILLALYFGSYALLRMFFYWYVLRSISSQAADDPSAVRYGVHLSVINAFVLVAGQIDKILVFHFLGAVEVAVYFVATAIPDNIKSIVRNIGVLAAPKYAALSEDEARRALPDLWRKTLFFTLLLLAGVVAYVLISPYLFRLIFPTYAEAVLFSQFYAFTILATSLGLPSALLQYQGRTRDVYILNIANNVMQIALIAAFVPLWGLWGAVWARLGSMFLNALVTVALVLWSYRPSARS